MEVKPDVLKQIPLYEEIGVHGITIEGLKHKKKKNGLIRVGSDWVYPQDRLKAAYNQIKEQCHAHGLKFYAAENRLRNMGDDLCCCGIDGLDRFVPNTYNLNHYAFDKERFHPTKAMTEAATSMCLKAIAQNTSSVEVFKVKSLKKMMEVAAKDRGMLGQLLSKV